MLRLGLDYGEGVVLVQNADYKEVVMLNEGYGEYEVLLALSYGETSEFGRRKRRLMWLEGKG